MLSSRLLRALRTPMGALNPTTRTSLRQQSTKPPAQGSYQAPSTTSSSSSSPSEPMTSHREFYKQFGLPMAKVFLGALFTYQLTYFLWLKLESLETQKEGDAEIRRLEGRLEAETSSKRGVAE